MNRIQSFLPLAFIFAVIGIFILFLALALSSAASFGGLIMIGPIPIAFGSSAELTTIAMIIGFMLIIVYFLFIYLFQRRMRESIEMKIERELESEPALEREQGMKVKGGGVVMIGPIPVIFGSDVKYASLAMALAIILMLLAIVLMFTGAF